MFTIKKILVIPFLYFLLFLRAYTQDYNCELIDYQEYNTIAGKKLIQDELVLLQINKRLGDKYANISIPHSKKIKAQIEKAQIEDIQGNIIRVLKKSEIINQSAISSISLYEDDYVKKFELKHNLYPYRIRYHIKYTYDEFMEISNWHPSVDPEVPTRNARLEIQTPFNYPIKYNLFKISDPKIDTIEKTIHYVFEAKDIILPKKEKYCPPILRITPFVRVVPETFNWITTGTHKNWIEYGQWIFKLTNGLDNLPETEKIKIHSLIKDKTNKLDIIKTLYQYLQSKTRYINVSIDVGGLKPYSAEYVSQNGYGDCKALSIYMKALLKEAGIPSFYTTIFAGEEYPNFITDFPCHQSNHILTCVPIENDTVFLECTDNSIPAGYLGVFTQGRTAFLVDENKSYLIQTPRLECKDVFESRSYLFNLNINNNCILIISHNYKGENFDYFNSMQNNLSNSEAEFYIRERIMNGLPGFNLIDWKLSKPNKDSAIINFYSKLEVHNYLKNYGPDFGLPIPSLGIPIFELPSLRKLPLCFNYPIFKCDTIKFIIPEIYKSKLNPEETSIKTKFGEYSFIPEIKGNEIIIKRKFIIYRGEYSLDEYPEFYKFVNDILKTERKLIMLAKI